MADIKTALENIAKQQRNIFIVNKRRKRQRRVVREILLDYVDHSSLHGLRYITERGVTAPQKIFWLVMFLASLYMCAYYISNVYVKWRTSPVIVSLDDKLVSVEDVPFPSVTICPQIKCRASVYNLNDKSTERFMYHIYNSTEEFADEYAKFEDISMLCRSKYNFKYGLPLREKINNSNVTKTIYYDVSPSPSNTIKWCLWRGSDVNCSFERVLTEDGVCFNFNSVSAEELFRNSSDLAINVTDNNNLIRRWNSESGYEKLKPRILFPRQSDNDRYVFPLRGSVNRRNPDLELILVANNSDRDILCNTEFTGFKIYLHNPLDLPQSSLYYYAALENEVTSLAVDVNIMKTSKSLNHYKPEVKQCYFPHEKYLKFFKHYTVNNCLMECLTNQTLEACNCVGLHMPHYDSTTNICKRDKWDCMNRVNAYMYERDKIYVTMPKEEEIDPCRCLPPCNNIEYSAEVSKTHLNLSLMSLNRNPFIDYVIPNRLAILHNGRSVNVKEMFSPDLRYSKVNIYFKKPMVVTMRRSELFGWTDFVSNVGGLLGLFLGFSVLSVVEILYFLTVKVWIALKRDKEENYALTPPNSSKANR